MSEGEVTMRGMVESRRTFREAGASERQLERFDRLPDFGRALCVGLLGRGPAEGAEDALVTVEEIARRRGELPPLTD